MKNYLKLILLFLPVIGFGQTQKTLRDLLWASVNPCYSMFEDVNEDGTPDFDKIDDSKNGYLKISGSWPTCGCTCSSTAAGYQNNDGSYTILQASEFTCSWEKKITSNRELKDILPEDFGINSFSSGTQNKDFNYPIFFINFNIPQYGTDTKVSIELVPFGLRAEGKDLYCFDYKEEAERNNLKFINEIKNISESIKDSKTLDYLLSGEFDKIVAQDNDILQKTIGESKEGFISYKEIQNQFKVLKKIYDIYSTLEYKEITLGWDRKNSRFNIKEKGKKMEKLSFKDFLINSKYWTPIC